MILDKAIRRRQSPSKPIGHQELDTDIISDHPIFDLNPGLGRVSFVDELADWPDKLEALVRWTAIPVAPQGITMQEVVDDQVLNVQAFYDPTCANDRQLAHASAHQGIILHVEQLQHEGIELSQSGPLHSKIALFQSPAQLIQTRRSKGQGRWHVSAPKGQLAGENIVPVLAYGIHAPPGCTIGEIEQTYATIGSANANTGLRLYKSSALRREGITPPAGGVLNDWLYAFVDEGPATSLVTDILQQRVVLSVKMGDSPRIYESVSYRDTSPADQLITITFKAK